MWLYYLLKTNEYRKFPGCPIRQLWLSVRVWATSIIKLPKMQRVRAEEIYP